jgi:hypothetical protein
MKHPQHGDSDEPAVYKKTWTKGPIFAVGEGNSMRSSDAYLLSARGAKQLADQLLPLVWPVDNQFCYLINTRNLSMFWAGMHDS